ncbi:alpha/beta fold hydrolase [Nonomuraea sediminis]|uniref:alpha/beta fold hydrolase n=1 Tax=Nonomuraea sediminis TaxID=2835864 RepID=UPI001BDD0E96|nr:alpha/beta fold hydrolase [Nonomuraea sediminis]
MMSRHALVFGAGGLIGRHLVLALRQAGVRVSAASRSPESYRRLARWLGDPAPADLRVDFGAPYLIEGDVDDVTEIYNCAGAYRFGMSMEEARRANVDSVRAIAAFAGRLPRLRRLVHVSGYRVGGKEPGADRGLGPYEASKVEGDAVLRGFDIPWTVVNPATVIGDDSDQQLGLAASVKEIWRGTMAALPGGAKTFVPVVSVDYLARFMTLLPLDEAGERASYWLLDDSTPALPDLLALVGRHYQVKVPRLRVPVPVVRRLPRWVTKAEPETFSFLSTDRYPTATADAFAARHGLAMPDFTAATLRWADHLAAHRFGDAPEGERRFTTVAGVRTFELGSPDAPTVVLPGLPVNADTWAPVVEALGQARAADLPGLGMSAGGPEDWPTWVAALGARHLVGHSIGAAAAVEAATDQALTLVSPFFLQPRGGAVPFARWLLRLVRPEALARRLTGDAAHAHALRSSVDDLRRGKVAANVARLLAATRSERRRGSLLAKLSRHPGPVHIIVGARDPLTSAVRTLPQATVTVIPDAGHHLQLTHPAELAQAIRSFGSSERPAGGRHAVRG